MGISDGTAAVNAMPAPPLVAIPKEVLGTEQGGQEILVEDRMAICDIIVSRVE